MRFFIEHTLTLSHVDVFEADSLEEARKIRDSLTIEYYDHLRQEFSRMPTEQELKQNIDLFDDGELYFPCNKVMSKQEFIKKYTSLED